MAKLICAWCKKIMCNQYDTKGGGDSHGMCDECLKKMKKDIEKVVKK